MLHVRFQSQAIVQLLQDLGYSLWSEHRPLLLVWLVVEDQQGAKRLMTEESEGPFANQVKTLLHARGLPMLFPVGDLNLMSTVSVDTVWNGQWTAFEPFAQHYMTDGHLVVRIKQVTEETWHANITLFSHDEQLDFIADNSDLNLALSSVIDQLGDGMANIQKPTVSAEKIP